MTRVRIIDTGGVIVQPDPKTAEQGEKCPACRMTVTNSQPDCRCS